MIPETATPERARQQGQLWGARAHDWALTEERQLPTYELALERVALRADQRVLDVGCGSGVFLRLAADRGALVAGLDASEQLVALARARVPDADVRVGDMEQLPFEDDSFDLVTGFNSFFFADDLVVALREAGRVARPGAAVLMQVWGPPDRCDLDAVRDAARAFLPEPGPRPPALWRPGALEGLAVNAGLTPESAFDTSYAIEFPDDETLARAMLAAGLAVAAIRHAGEQPVREAILEALARFRTAGGGYRLHNEWHYLIARA